MQRRRVNPAFVCSSHSKQVRSSVDGDSELMMKRFPTVAAILTAGALSACGHGTASGPPGVAADTTKLPLSDMTANARYLGFEGGLYPGGNTIPATHLAAGTARAKLIAP